ncbi:hypothetical protein D7V97_32805 [Corallococcus sp. CA053C]|uniref:hypothetical protein n=1 Tax=Corallococcus sp. CA053C TaxID=2316732 RepID=UPI000EA18A23|nr:hypothetical protein [Corallococcus sp. CA053C]RKG98599.1 hypothetical protein D7V97_32805 [Corallococcus sp. CA053C]
MAGLDWVQVDVGFPMSLAVIGAARSLDMDRRAFLGAMVKLQAWAVQAFPKDASKPLGPSADLSAGRPWDASADTARTTPTPALTARAAAFFACSLAGSAVISPPATGGCQVP